MLKVIIWPSFINKSLFEIKKEGEQWILLVTKESHEYNQDPGKIWINTQLDSVKAMDIISKVDKIIENPESDLRVISDGVSVELRLKIDDIETRGKFRTPTPGSKEQKFISELMELTKTAINDIEFHDYMESLKTYFFDLPSVKNFI